MDVKKIKRKTIMKKEHSLGMEIRGVKEEKDYVGNLLFVTASTFSTHALLNAAERWSTAILTTFIDLEHNCQYWRTRRSA